MAGFERQDPIRRHVLQEHLRDDPESGSSPLEAWQTSLEIPTANELMAMDPPPLPQLWQEAPSKKNYLEFQYWINRYEGTEPLRRAINEVRSDPNMMENDNCYIYSQVHVQGYMFAKSGVACRISFSTERSPSRVIWGQSGRLTAGTLVALSPSGDNFKSQCFVAVVAARPLRGGVEPDPDKGEGENTAPRIDIYWANHSDSVLNPSVELTMVEAKSGFFESVRHTLVGLQHSAFYESRFDKYIVDGCDQPRIADHARRVPTKIPAQASSFDTSQKEAFETMTSTEFAMVQGPPGTGKTFTSVVAIQGFMETLVSNGDANNPPVVVAAQTNHALDQLLEKCIRAEASVVRLGTRSKVPVINERTMFNLSKDFKGKKGSTRGENARKEIIKKINDFLSMAFPKGLISAEHLRLENIITEEQFESLRNDEWETAGSPRRDDDDERDVMTTWLKECIEQDRTYIYCPPREQAEPEEGVFDQAQLPEDDDLEHLQGEFISIQFYLTGSIPKTMPRTSSWYHQACKYLSRCSDMYKIKPPQRGMVYRHLRHLLIEKVANRLPGLFKQYNIACSEIRVNNWNRNVKILQSEGVQIVGCTTTGLNKYRGLIAALQPRILMVEEAAESQEATITSALYPSLEQVVLVGDHQQLVPSVTVRELEGYPYYLNKSLFERLVNLQVPYSMLKVQRRMIPLIRSVVHTFYPQLEDHDSVKDPGNRKPIPGMGGQNLWWFQHQWGESQNANHSFFNANEAMMVVGFVQYLVQNGVRPSEITILTYYKGQVSVIMNHLRQNEVLAGYNPAQDWSVRTVDGFQGEENDVIILSLVRSPTNPHNRFEAGFVKNENRAVVATSRARRGMYIFGNSNNLLGSGNESVQTWGKIYDVFVKEKCTGYQLPVVCRNHGQVTHVRQPTDWQKIPHGGCELPCDEKCPKGHSCASVCHAFEQSRVKCTTLCKAALFCGHNCDALCGESCRCPRGCVSSTTAKMSLPLVLNIMPSNSTESVCSGISSRYSNSNEKFHGSIRGRGTLRGGRGGRGGRGAVWHPNGVTKSTKNQSSLDVEKSNPNLLTSKYKHNSRFPSSIHGQPKQEPTSEELMDLGYHARVGQGNDPTPMSNIMATNRGATTGLISLESAVESTSCSEESLSEKWSPQKVQEGDRALQLMRQNQCSPTPQMMVIRETFQSTLSTGTNNRQRPVVVEHKFPTSQHQEISPVGDVETSADERSRKQRAQDAAAGFKYVDPVGKASPMGSESPNSQGLSSEIAMEDEGGEEDDLICFD